MAAAEDVALLPAAGVGLMVMMIVGEMTGDMTGLMTGASNVSAAG